MTFVYWIKSQWDISKMVRVETMSVFYMAMGKLSEDKKLHLSNVVEREIY